MAKPINYTPYARLTVEEKYGELRKIECFLQKYALAVKIDYNSIACRHKVLLDIIERVEKRRVYFRVFHGIEMSEKYEIALYCFWIIKLAPFFVSESPEDQTSIKFAAFLFLHTIGEIGRKQRPPLNMRVGKEYVDSLVYSFLYWDLSKEAMMKIADSLLV